MKKAIVKINSENENIDHRPETFLLEITEKLALRIKALSELVTQIGAVKIDEFEYSGVWSYYYLDGLENIEESENQENEVLKNQINNPVIISNLKS